MRTSLPPRHTVIAALAAAACLASVPGSAWAGSGGGGKRVLEGNAGFTEAKASIDLHLLPPHPPVTVRYQTVDGTATAGDDYLARSGFVTFGPLDTEADVRIPVRGDTLHEGDETFFLETESATPGAEDDGERITIVDDDAAPSVSVADTTIAENTGQARFTVSLSSPSGLPATVGYATADGTATAPADYAATTGTLTFAPGETTKVVSVDVVPDTAHEDNETLALALSNPLGATLGTPALAHATILDDDAAPAATPPVTSAATTASTRPAQAADTSRVLVEPIPLRMSFAGLTRGGRAVLLHLSCPAERDCAGTAQVVRDGVTLGSADYALAGGTSGELAIPLSRHARRALKRRGHLALVARADVGKPVRFTARLRRTRRH